MIRVTLAREVPSRRAISARDATSPASGCRCHSSARVSRAAGPRGSLGVTAHTHGVTEDEVEQVLAKPGKDRAGRESAIDSDAKESKRRDRGRGHPLCGTLARAQPGSGCIRPLSLPGEHGAGGARARGAHRRARPVATRRPPPGEQAESRCIDKRHSRNGFQSRTGRRKGGRFLGETTVTADAGRRWNAAKRRARCAERTRGASDRRTFWRTSHGGD